MENIMKLSFTKMHGAGNDYIYFNCFVQDVPHPQELAITLSDRHFGIGGDGIVLICPSEIADARMRMFNADGSEGKMCGNAIRCVGKYLFDSGMVQKDNLAIETLSGIKTLELTVKNGKVDSVTVDMGKAILSPGEIPVALEGEKIVARPLNVDGEEYSITCVSMGNPHCVVFVENPDLLKLEKLGPPFENHPTFPQRINTEFVQILDKNNIRMRVWERGSGETLACGTGACASVVACVLNGYCSIDEEVTVALRGGELRIRYMSDGTVFMTGGAARVFDGEIILEGAHI